MSDRGHDQRSAKGGGIFNFLGHTAQVLQEVYEYLEDDRGLIGGWNSPRFLHGCGGRMQSGNGTETVGG
jgi:hypothetical protein